MLLNGMTAAARWPAPCQESEKRLMPEEEMEQFA